ncbi:MAG TPA: transglycosylase domain-containing protein [Gammaproteobacteria bacterium]|nr:transglycosylase domain-containing protein [Gammaproteobacteria bacterium]
MSGASSSGQRARSGARRLRLAALLCGVVVAAAVAALALRTSADLRPLPATLRLAELPDGAADDGLDDTPVVRVVDRNGEPLNATFGGAWNRYDVAALHEVPQFLRDAFVAAEDKRFFDHAGVDWRARFSAVLTNVRNGRAVRGASTITEQVVGMLHPRPRSVWSRWLEGFEAAELERRVSKNEVLEFYLNQVPYAANRRGVVQAASYYFARDLATLGKKEMLALAVLVRAPTRFDLARNPRASEGAIERLADALVERGALTGDERAEVLAEPLVLEAPRLAVSAPHFVRHVRTELGRNLRPAIAALPPSMAVGRDRAPAIAALPPSMAVGRDATAKGGVATTLDARLQSTVQRLLDERLRYLAPQLVDNGAVLAVDHSTGEVLAWVVAGGGDPDGPASYIDAITTPRQPGSALKPFLYALALDRGWSAAQIIDDAPLAESTSNGIHNYRNYSRRFYGPVALRDALGNSLNIPALKTLQYVGADNYLGTLAALGFTELTAHPDFYGDGIALGSGAVSLYEMVQAYAALANGGVFRPLTTRVDDPGARPSRRVFSADAASLVANILSDADARALEFGRSGVLSLPVQTAVKTGTSSDFHDAWAVGFDYRYTVGVWMGNLDQLPSDGLTGSTGPALVLRSVLAELTRAQRTEPLYLSPRLVRRQVCVPVLGHQDDGSAAIAALRMAAARDPESAACVAREEWFVPGTEPGAVAPPAPVAVPVRLRRPTPGLQLAYDPRLPAEAQVFELAIDGVAAGDRVAWAIDGSTPEARSATYRWPVARGSHRVGARVFRGEALVAALDEVEFLVK